MMFEKEILESSLKYNIPTVWIKAIIAQESNWDPLAIRFEPSYSYLYNKFEIAKNCGVTVDTEVVCQKMSWGLGQIMGGLARSRGLEGPMGQLFNPETNIDFMGRFLKDLKGHADNTDDIFAMYNGGPRDKFKNGGKYPNQSYVDSVKKHMQSFT